MKRKFLYGIYFLSGTAGLVYEVLWMRYFSGLFGNTAKGAAMVLGVFFLGMALGSCWGGRRAARSPSPLRLYARLEFGIALAAAPIPFLMPLYEWIYPTLFAALEMAPFVFDLVRFFMALVITLPAGILLGATFPVMGEILIQDRAALGRTSASLYGVNTLGAACGVVLTGFFLPPLIGILMSYGLAVATNLVLGGLVLFVVKGEEAWKKAVRVQMKQKNAPESEFSSQSERDFPGGLILSLAFGSGLGMIALEVLWTRMLALVLHNSVYSFSAIVLVVLLGLASGAFFVSFFQRCILRPEILLSLSFAGVALLVLFSPFLFFKLTGLAYFALGAGWPGYLFQVLKLAAALIFLPTLCAGMALPLLWRMFERSSRSVGLSLGTVNLWNLMGSLLGGWLAGFLLIPLMGLWQGMAVISGLYFLLSQGFLFFSASGFPARSALPKRRRVASFALSTFAVLAVVMARPGDYAVQRLKAGERLLYLHEGEEAVVSVVEDASKIRWLKSNNTYHLGATLAVRGEKRLGHLPLLLHPSPKKVAFVGIGTGISMSAALDHEIDALLGIEILPGVMAALPYFSEQNMDLLSHSKVKTVVGDGRVYLRSTNQRFDVIVADLFVPWRAGVGALYTLEHFEAVRDHLNPEGLFVQWLPLYQMSEWDFGTLSATFSEAFPHVSVWRGDFSSKAPILGLVGSLSAITLEEQALEARLKSLAARSRTPDPLLQNFPDFSLLYGGDLDSLADWHSAFPINTEDKPVIEFQSPMQQSEGRQFKRAAIAAFYKKLKGGRVLVKRADSEQARPLSPEAGNLLFQAVEAGLARDSRRQLASLKEAVSIQPESTYLKLFNVVLRAVDAGATRGLLQRSLKQEGK